MKETRKKRTDARSRAGADRQRREEAAARAEKRMPGKALYLYAGTDNLERVKALMERGCDPAQPLLATDKAYDLLTTTAFHEACCRGAFNVVAHFIKSGCDRGVRDGFGMRPQDVIANKTKDKDAHARILGLFLEADRKEAQERKEREEFLRAAQRPLTGRSLKPVKPISFS